MSTENQLERGRDAFARRAWTEAFELLSAADKASPIDPEDLHRLASAAYLTGKDNESTDAWTRAHQEFLNRNDPEHAARCAYWLAFGLLEHGERARAGGWITRAQHLLDDAHRDCVERGYLLLPVALETLLSGDAAGAYAKFCEAAEIGSRFGDRDLIALAQHSRGRVLIRMGDIRKGIRLLDEAMISIETGELSPLVVGDVYCSVIEGCMEIHDLRRAQEWTAALTRWCESQPDLVPFSGQCLLRRAEILQLHGSWSEAADAAQRACERFLHGGGQRASGSAFYQCGELHRLRGEFEEAEECYRQASRYGRKPQPGLALLRLAHGQTEQALTTIRLAVDEANGPLARSRLLPAYVEILLASGEVAAARDAAEELAKIAADRDATLLHAASTKARGAVALEEGDARAALAMLRQSWTYWQEIESPYETARVRVLIGLACRILGDPESAEMEFDAAGWIFRQLNARPDLDEVERLARKPPTAAVGGLSTRETEVLRLVAAGKTNRDIAEELYISERTVERHVSNIFVKLNVSSRAAATAYAFKHKLV